MFSPDQLPDSILSTGLFLALWYLLGIRIFGPFFQMLEEREMKTSGAEKILGNKREELKTLERQLDDLLRQARLDGIAMRDGLLVRAKAEGSVIAGKALMQADSELQRARADLDRLREKIRQELHPESEKLASLLCERVVSAPADQLLH
jgi:F0F1-type ATP synthase membrane subunit b/b'